jgi:chaperonin GroEL
MRGIVQNAGLDGSVVIETVRREKGSNTGFDVITGQYGDMIKLGITDPVKVTRSAVENASSIAGMILTTEALITDIPEKEKAPAMPAGGMDY